jgi:hypothetical protein
MKRPVVSPQDLEPVGIVISRGSRQESAPVVWAYVYGPAPEAAKAAAPAKVSDAPKAA